ncbi:MAG: hypothetical protein OEL19_03010 [Sulfurimonas sp.]|nr:hypothetical protein [Sulfurimonas sp.]
MAIVPLTLTDSQGYIWDIYSNGSISGGTNDAYDGGFVITSYTPSSTTVLEEESGREIVFQPTVVATDISLERKIYVPTGTTYGYARFLDSITNTGSTVQTFTLTINSNLGSDGNEQFKLTSDGGTTLEATDSWIITDDSLAGATGGDSAVAHVFNLAGATGVTTATYTGGNIAYTYQLSLNPGETKSIMHFGVQSASNVDIQTVVNFIASGDSQIYTGLSTAELQQLVNFEAVVPVSTYAMTSSSLSHTEGENISFTVTRTGDLSAAGSVGYTISGTGSAQATADDFVLSSLSGTVQFAAGVQTQTVTIALSQDTTLEADETFQVTLSNGVNGAVSSTASSATGTIINDDPVLLTANSDMYNGTTVDDFVNGSLGDDTMHGLDGNDRLFGGSGDDMLFGETGNDTLEGGLGDNFLYGGSGNDTLYATSKLGSVGELMTNSNQTVIASTGQSLSISLTAPEAIDGTTATVEGLVSRSASQSGAVNIAYIIDYSGSMSSAFGGTSVGDQNGDGSSNELIDAAIASYKSLTTSLLSTGFDGSNVALIPFSDAASVLYTGVMDADTNANGVKDVVDSLVTLDSYSGTNFTSALDQAVTWFTGRSGLNYIFFVSDGYPNDTNYQTQVQTLINSAGINATIKALGLGSGASLTALDLVDDYTANSTAIRVDDTDALTAGLVASPVSSADIDRVELYKDGVLIQTIAASSLISTPLGLKFTADIAGLIQADNTITAKVIATDTDSTALSVSQNIATGAGTNTLFGGSGSDMLVSGSGSDYLNGGSGSDTASYELAASGVTVNLSLLGMQNTIGGGVDTLVYMENLLGSSYADTLTGDALGNIINGGAGNDTINGAAGNDIINGGAGNDIIDGNAGNDKLIGGAGVDTLTYETATAAVAVNLGITTAQATGGSGSDTISQFENLTGSGYNDILVGDTLANTIIGGAGNDTINGGGGNDIVNGGAGNDKLIGGAGVDTLTYETATAAVTVNLGLTVAQATGGSGSDTISQFENLTGSNHHDTLTGNALANAINGGAGNDWMNGAAGGDVLTGLAGNDTLIGGGGNDRLSGGAGVDSFVFNAALSATGNKDTITDFVAADDTISLENAIFAKLTTTGALSAANFVASSSGNAVDANDYVLYNTTSGVLSYDADGNGAGAAVAFALLGTSTHPTITAADFVVI